MNTLAWSLILGATLGTGLWCAVSAVPIMRKPQLMHRVAPYILGVSQGARDLVARRTVNPLQLFETTASPIAVPVKRLVTQVLGASSIVRLRLRQSGSAMAPERYRWLQLILGLLGAIGGLLLGIMLAVRGAPPLIPLLLAPLAGMFAAMAMDYRFARRARARLERISAELPTMLEFLSLSLSAGESLADALRRISASAKGDVAEELRGVVREHASGVALSEALMRLERELQHPPMTRFIDQLRTALERGAPLAGVLQAQAVDVREEAKRKLLESAGKKEILMLVPLVFGLLPVTIAFALFPGLYVLQLGF